MKPISMAIKWHFGIKYTTSYHSSVIMVHVFWSRCILIVSSHHKIMVELYRKLIKRFSKSEPSRFTREEAIKIAAKYNLVDEVLLAMKYGYTPDEALQDWDIYPY